MAETETPKKDVPKKDVVKKDVKTDNLIKAIKKLEKLGFTDIKADLEGYESPVMYRGRGDTGFNFAPEVSAKMRNRTAYFCIASKDSKENEIAMKWRLFASLAARKEGIFSVFTPTGTISSTKTFLEKQRIVAETIRL